MNRTQALELWKRVADGDLEREEREQLDPFGRDDLLAWIRQVAQKVVDADTVPDRVRPGTLVDAIGLSGRLDPYSDVRRTLEIISEFSPIGEDGEYRQFNRGENKRRLVEEVRRSGLFPEQMTDEEIRKRIDRFLQSNRADTAKSKK